MKEWLGKVRGRSLMAAFLVLGGGLVAALCFMLADDQLLGLELP